MKTLSFVLIVVCLMCLIPSILYGQASVKGVVTDATTREGLVGVNVVVVGTSLGAPTNVEGEYKISGIPQRMLSLKFSCVGFESKIVEVDFASNASSQVNVVLTPVAIEGKEVVVTAQMRGQTAAINRQISASTMINAVSADKIRELPDQNAAEAVGRLPGISVIRSAGEASKVVVRGLEPKLNAITINGVKIPSTAQNDRSVDLSMIATETLEGIEVFKATTPDMDAEAIGGVVNLKIKKAPSERKIQLKATPGYNQLAKTYGDYKFSAEFSDRFLDQAIGVVATANYEKVNRSSENLSGAYQVLGLRDTVTGAVPIGGTTFSVGNSLEERTRGGVGLTLDYAFENGTIWLTNFYSQTSRDPFSTRKQYDPRADQIVYTVEDRRIKLDGLSNSLNGEFSLWGLDMDAVLSSYFVTNDQSYDFTMTLRQGSPFDNTKLKVNDVWTYIPAAKDDIKLIQLRDNYDTPNKTTQTDLTGQYNAKLPFSLSGDISGYLKGGAKYSRSDRDNKADGHGMGQYYLGGQFISGAQQYYNKPFILNSNGQISSENFITSATDYAQVVEKRFTLFPLYNRDVVKDWCEQQRPYFQFDRNSLADSYDLQEAITAGYLMAEAKYGSLITLVAGARYEYENSRYSSVWTSAYEIYGRSGIQKDTTRTRVSDNWFPHVHLKVQATEGLDFRLSINRSLARPDYYWISPWTRLDISNATIQRGNPDLNDAKVWNYNLSTYFYNNVTGFFSLSGFYKEIDNIFYRRRSQVFRPEDIDALGIPGREGGYQMTSYDNAERSEVKGIEIEWQTQLSFYPGMPEILKGIVLNLNYSRIWSKTFFPFYKFNATVIPGSRPPKYTYDLTDYFREGPMPGQADQIANISVGYDIGDFSSRLSFSYQGSSIVTVGEIAESDTWNKAFLRWDALVKYRFAHWLSLSLNLVNISSQPDEAFYGAEVYPTSEFHYGMTGSVTVEVTL